MSGGATRHGGAPGHRSQYESRDGVRLNLRAGPVYPLRSGMDAPVASAPARNCLTSPFLLNHKHFGLRPAMRSSLV